MNEQNDAVDCAGADLLDAGRPATLQTSVLERQTDEECIAPTGHETYQTRRPADGHADDDWFGAASEFAARETTEPRAVRLSGVAAHFPRGFRHACA